MSLYGHQEEEEDFPHLNEDDIDEVLEDDGERPGGLDDDDLDYGHDEDMQRLEDGIEGMGVAKEEPKDNNSWGATGESIWRCARDVGANLRLLLCSSSSKSQVNLRPVITSQIPQPAIGNNRRSR